MLLVFLLAACSATPPTVNRYDFGIPAAPTAGNGSDFTPGVDVAVLAPVWLDTPAVLYRLAYADESQLHAYTQSQWVAPPSRLVEQALKSAAAGSVPRRCGDGSAAAARLDVELQEFSQDFESPQSSHVVLRARVRVLSARAHAVLAQRDFDLRAPAPTPDGPGAVHGLRDLAGAFAANAVAWSAAAAPCPAPAATATPAP